MNETEPSDVRVTFERSIKTLARWTVVLYTVVAVIFGGLFLQARSQRARVEADGARVHTALCTFVDDLQRRAQATADFLDKNEGREPIEGITRQTLRQGLQNQRKTLESLEGLGC